MTAAPATIRAARPDDQPRIAAALDEWWAGRRLRHLLPPLFLQHFAGTSLVAEDAAGRLAGFLVGFRSPDAPAEAYVHAVGVAPDHRGAGLGRSLYRRFAEPMAAAGVRTVRAVTSPGNEGSIAFHRALGFVVGAPVADYAGPGEARVPMAWALVVPPLDRATPRTARRPEPVTLQGRRVRLEPLGPQHVAPLADLVAGDDEVWLWLSALPQDRAELADVVDTALAEQAAGTRLPFAIVALDGGPDGGLDRGPDGDRVVGSTSYLDVDAANRRIEIGWTYLARPVWRSAVNTEAKLLLMGHAFDDLGFERVAFKTHHRNERSQAAIARLGAVREGTLRHHVLHRDGTWRDSVYFSVLAAEWPAVRTGLLSRLAAS